MYVSCVRSVPIYVCVLCVGVQIWPCVANHAIKVYWQQHSIYSHIADQQSNMAAKKKQKQLLRKIAQKTKKKIGCFCGGVGGCVYVTGFMAFRSNYATYINIIMRVLLQLCQLKKSINLACVQWVCWWLRINENFPKEATKTTPECMHKVQCFVRIELYLCIHICIFMLFISFHCLYVCTTFRFWRAHTK